MDDVLLLTKAATLLFRESQLSEKTENSGELVRTVLNNIQVSDIGIGLSTNRDMILNLKSTILEMCNNPFSQEYVKEDILQRLRVNTKNDDVIYAAFEQGILPELSESAIKKTVVGIRREIASHFKQETICKVLNEANVLFKYKRGEITDINAFITNVVSQLEVLQVDDVVKDPAILDDVDFSCKEDVQRVFERVSKNDSGGGIYRTGFNDIDTAIQGGIRRGSTTVINALQHKYKTGFSLSVFKGIAMLNKPQTDDPKKKPLLLRISCEDDLELNLQFLYQSIKYDETRIFVDTKNTSVEEMTAYVQEKLGQTGFNVRFMRVDPTMWTYKSIINQVYKLESEGYQIEVLMIDYLTKIPTTGCIMGATGKDIRDMYRRIRNFCAGRGIAFITPHQLSTEAKGLIRGGMPEDQFVKEIAEKGYYSGSKEIDQEVDLEIYIHLFKHNKETWLSFMRGKHRIPTILEDDSLKYGLYKFPKGMPIPMDREGESTCYRKLPSFNSVSADLLFS